MKRDEIVASLDGRCYCHTRGPSRHHKIWSCVEPRKPELAPPSGSGGVSHATGALPVPWQQRREVGDLVLGDAREHLLGHSVASEYATRSGLSVEDYLFKRYGPPMSPAHVGEQVADMLDSPKFRSGVA